MTILAGLDIGGTKCAVLLGKTIGDDMEVIERVQFPTPSTPDESIEKMALTLDQLQEKHNVEKVAAIGISCGGPLNSKTGTIIAPPNLPGWENIEIVKLLEERYQIPVALQNDANAGAMAEWRWGAGKGTENMMFLTFGTGMGAGLILNGQLYSGTNDLAGEVGHIRLAEDGPIGFGKAGSFEGFCSGGGIAKLAAQKALEALQKGNPPTYCSSMDELSTITTKSVGEAAQAGDHLALEVFSMVGFQLGRALSLFVDILNPEKIVIGSIYGRQQDILEPIVLEELKKEAIPLSYSVCDIIPAGLGEKIGDLASFSVALLALKN
ncbi:ROK family protein [Gracilibacillus salitolerans]|uniref:ROK family protein n=1 Tax=Gracilibacillus salitolerans TaxID=2663022 RepID=A0A5Q2TI29_9BACI|nr:ROK family protein [Gracilibacillus salitolerans]QGH33652.1 ROK family protein [Gracilibacillus salitolerans]